jgi:hypothetical protein
MLDFLKSLFGVQEEKRPAKVTVVKATRGPNANKANNPTKEKGPDKADNANKIDELLFKNKKYGKYGFVNTKGEQVVECKFDEANDFKEGLAVVQRGYKRFIINIKGDFVALKEGDSKIEIIKEISDKSGNNFFLSNSDDKFGLLDANYNVLIKNKFYGEFEVVQRMNENTFLIKMAEKEFFIDNNGDFK